MPGLGWVARAEYEAAKARWQERAMATEEEAGEEEASAATWQQIMKLEEGEAGRSLGPSGDSRNT
jgi:hypothetical protein